MGVLRSFSSGFFRGVPLNLHVFPYLVDGMLTSDLVIGPATTLGPGVGCWDDGMNGGKAGLISRLPSAWSS